MKKLLFLTILLATLIPTSASAVDASNFHFQSFEADYYLTRESDGTSTLEVEEYLTAVFPSHDQNHGITRIIPFTNRNGKNFTMNPDVLSISATRNGEEEPVAEVENHKSYFEVYLGQKSTYLHGKQRYGLNYTYTNVITAPNGDMEHQELYWDTLGNGSAQRFDSLEARVHLDEASAAAWTGEAWCYVGAYGSGDQFRCYWEQIEPGVIEFSVIGSLDPYENLTFDLTFAPDTFIIPPIPIDDSLPGYLMMICFISGVSAIIMLAICTKQRPRYKKWKHTFVPPEYQPPKNLTVAESCVLSTHGKSRYSIPATIVELAISGHIKLEEIEVQNLISKKARWHVNVIKTKGLSRPQIAALTIVNNGHDVSDGDKIHIQSHSESRSLTEAHKLYKSSTEAALFHEGLMQKSSLAKRVYILPIIFSINAFFIISASIITATETYGAIVANIWLLAIIIPLILFVTAWHFWMAARTAKVAKRTDAGLDTERYLEGLRQFIKLAESDRIKFLQSVKGAERIDTSDGKKVVKLYEKLLPYAIIFGLEKSWGLELERRYEELGDSHAPLWFAGMHAFNASAVSSQVHSITSSVSSSSSSGSSGGGFSGGGGGGGGAGGW